MAPGAKASRAQGLESGGPWKVPDAFLPDSTLWPADAHRNAKAGCSLDPKRIRQW
jgi:hypothetical protein